MHHNVNIPLSWQTALVFTIYIYIMMKNLTLKITQPLCLKIYSYALGKYKTVKPKLAKKYKIK